MKKYLLGLAAFSCGMCFVIAGNSFVSGDIAGGSVAAFISVVNAGFYFMDA